jgi:asparagine synthase (glutamine-hydrolysing)
MSYQGVTTVKQLIHVNSRRWAAKALSAGEGLGIRCIYPYIWKEILIEQGKLPWDLKIRRGVVKWPLKRLLEEFMPRDFIYRKKSGFVPPFAAWIATDEFNQIARETLLSRNGVITGLVPAKVIDTLLSDALARRRLRHPILNFLWGALFTELWLKEQGMRP